MVELECHKTIKTPSRRGAAGAGTVTQPAADSRLACEKCDFCGKNKFQLLFCAVQVALPYYIREMVKSMHQDGIALEADLEMMGHLNLFKSTSKEWDLLQTLHVHTLLYTQVRTGDRWKNGYLRGCGFLRRASI